MFIKHTDAAILVKQNQDLIVDKIQLPDNLQVGQVFGHIIKTD